MNSLEQKYKPIVDELTTRFTDQQVSGYEHKSARGHRYVVVVGKPKGLRQYWTLEQNGYAPYEQMDTQAVAEGLEKQIRMWIKEFDNVQA